MNICEFLFVILGLSIVVDIAAEVDQNDTQAALNDGNDILMRFKRGRSSGGGGGGRGGGSSGGGSRGGSSSGGSGGRSGGGSSSSSSGSRSSGSSSGNSGGGSRSGASGSSSGNSGGAGSRSGASSSSSGNSGGAGSRSGASSPPGSSGGSWSGTSGSSSGNTGGAGSNTNRGSSGSSGGGSGGGSLSRNSGSSSGSNSGRSQPGSSSGSSSSGSGPAGNRPSAGSGGLSPGAGTANIGLPGRNAQVQTGGKDVPSGARGGGSGVPQSNVNFRPQRYPQYWQRPAGGWRQLPPRGQGVYVVPVQPARRTVVIVRNGPSYYAPPPNRAHDVMLGIAVGYQLGRAHGDHYYHYPYYYYHSHYYPYYYTPWTRYCYVRETDRYYYYGEDSYVETREIQKATDVKKNVTVDEAVQALLPISVAMRCTYSVDKSANLTGVNGTSVKEIVFECDRRIYVCCDLDCCLRTDVNTTAWTLNSTQADPTSPMPSETSRPALNKENTSRAQVACKSPYTQIDTTLSSGCALINDSATAAISFEQAEWDCLIIGGRVLSVDTPAKLTWLRAQKRQKPCWYGPRQRAGCTFIFSDNSNDTDAECTGRRGVFRYDVKCFACEALQSEATKNEAEHTSTTAEGTSFCPPNGSINSDCSPQYEFEEGTARSIDQCREHCAFYTACQAFTYAPKMANGKSNCFLYNFACDKFGTTVTMAADVAAADGVHYYRCDSTVSVPPSGS